MPETTDVDTDDAFWRRLLYRWFVEYNPLYLLSASLVLGGMILLSRGLARAGSVHGELGIAAIAELYAISLIAGAALLTRIGQRRPAVMLSLLTILYQCDLTLHTETCAHLGGRGMWAALAWLALFAGKLKALAWAMKIRLSARALLITTVGGAGIAALPPVIAVLDARAASALVTGWLAGLVFMYRAGAVTSLVELDAWGRIVLRRAVRASWALLGVLLTLHVVFWSAHYRLDLGIVVATMPLLATRWVRGEARVWMVVGATLLFFALALPRGFAAGAFVATIALGSRAVAAARSPVTRSTARQHVATSAPYRVLGGEGERPAAPPPTVELVADAVTPGGPAAMVRLATGAASALYLAIWTARWSGGPWPAHVIPLDMLFAAVVVVAVWKLRLRYALGPLAASVMHLVVQHRLVPAPRSVLEWGGAAVGLGFVLLIASLVASYWLRTGPPRGTAPSPMERAMRDQA